MILEDVAILAADTSRSRIYLQALEVANLLPSTALVLAETSDKNLDPIPSQSSVIQRNGASFDLSISVEKLIDRMNIPLKRCNCLNPNAEDALTKIKELKQSIIIYSGPAGTILHEPVLDLGKKFLHIHPGKVPQFRGSTTIYYSLIKEGKAGASAFFMDREIDKGPLIIQRDFPELVNTQAIDYFEDSYIRAQLLKQVLGAYSKSGRFEVIEQATSEEEETYFVIHPILKSIAIFGAKK
jgi:methionyl-tRNA formyltransferase